MTSDRMRSWTGWAESDQKRPPARSRQQPACGSQEDSIGRRQLRTTCLPAKHRQLMPKQDDLQLLELARASTEQNESEHAPERQIAERPEQQQLLRVSGTGARLYDPRARTQAGTELTHPHAGQHPQRHLIAARFATAATKDTDADSPACAMFGSAHFFEGR
jgi:hypothetical protein